MGRARRRLRLLGHGNGNGNGYAPDAALLAAVLAPAIVPGSSEPPRSYVPMTGEPLAPVYVPVPADRPPVVAPVLPLEGLDPWAEIRGPALAVEEPHEAGEVLLPSRDPAQLELDHAAPVVAADVAPAAAAAATPAAEAAATVVAPEAEAGAADATPAGGPVFEFAPPSDPIDVLYDEARAASDAGNCEEARQLFVRLLGSAPTHVRARRGLALVLDAQGNHQGALAELDRALDIDPGNSAVLVSRGALLGAMGRYAAAERDLRNVVRVEPSNAEALYHLGVVMTKKGLWAEAIPHLRRSLEVEPSRGSAYYYLGEALNHVDDLGGALASYRRAAELQPANPRALYGLGIIYDRLARPDDAAYMYRRAREVGRR